MINGIHSSTCGGGLYPKGGGGGGLMIIIGCIFLIQVDGPITRGGGGSL